MESGDLITENRPRKKIVRRRPADRDAFGELKRMVNRYIASNFKEWFDIHREGKLKRKMEIMINDGNDNEEEIGDGIAEIYRDEFIEDLTNRWNEPKCPNFFKEYKLLNVEFTARDFIYFWKGCCEWFENAFGEGTDLEDEEYAWNTICYWVFNDKLMDEWDELFTEKFKEEFCNYKDTRNRTSRIPCGVCYENKILYTGCSCCNNNYLCHSCYDKVDNECPFCRCDEMVKEADNFSEDLSCWVEKMECVLRDIPSAVENAVMEQCYECKKDIRWRDKTGLISEKLEYLGDERWLTHEELVCIPCSKKWRRIESLEEQSLKLDDSIPRLPEFSEWVDRTIRIHFRIRSLNK